MSHPKYVPNELLGRLVGCRLFSVQFVMDYLQLRFDGPPDDDPVLTCNVLPRVELSGRTWTSDELGWADALRSLIPQHVVATTERTGVGLRLELEEGAVSVHPRDEDLTGPEIALLSGFSDLSWMCWRPGEESFEDL